MREPDFDGLRGRLLERGIAPRHASRTVVELREHYADLMDELTLQGMDPSGAADEASRQLGPLDDIARLVCARPELRSWSYRYPRVGRLVLPIVWAATLPVSPVVASIEYAPAIARWGAILTASAAITAATLLVMQLSITLG